MNLPEIIKNDPYLQPFEADFRRWEDKFNDKKASLLGEKSVVEFAAGHHYFGLFKNPSGWVIREWAPHATKLYLTGSFNNWQELEDYQFTAVGNGCWELKLGPDQLAHQDLYALSIYWNEGQGKRIPAWTQRAVQDPETLIFNAQVWAPERPYVWKNKTFSRSPEAPLIYEAHIGMAGEEASVHSFNEFRLNILPRIKSGGYNTIQLMAIPEHPYYGSFGYHVSSFFAASSRFGTPEELMQLIDEAHGMGISVIMDIVHSHAVKNVVEGLGNYDGTRYQFFHDGNRGEHPAWDSYCFNYSKDEVLHFLLSNIRFWLEHYKFDGFRFDGVTSMLYFDHGLEKAFTSYTDYFTPNIDDDAIVYFKLANTLIHELNPNALSIAEDMSGLPGLAAPLRMGGLGFDYRMSMGVPDYWIKLIKEHTDENWNVGQLFHELTSHRGDEKVVSYAESHDQAMVGDKTIIFRLLDKEMYYSMRKDQPNLAVDRGIALHKMIRLATITCAGGAYLNFMGNEFGHPEWIDFPREGNGWSYQQARRLWSISENPELRFHWLLDFDRDMINLVKREKLLEEPYVQWITDNQTDQVLAFKRKDLLFIFNFNPAKSFEGYGIHLEPSKYKIILQTDAHAYGGFNRIDDRLTYYSIPEAGLGSTHYLKIYLPSRTAIVLKREPYKSIR
ncbi:MAG: alpha amylase C-terminal domain-containing protein [Bacteroidia bacterium]|nr:alpha amylase C-terminal domain-containing protein [Bacteroidia bacterium]